jgi:putative oxidoreductase
MKAAFVIGRLIFGGFFFYNGIHHFQDREKLAQYAAAKQVPLPEEAVAATGALLLAGGASLMLGLQPKWGAAAILLFLVGTSPTMHDFWRVTDPGQRMNDMINFSKNMALAGAALSLMAIEEPWPASISVGSEGNRRALVS